MYNGNKSVFVDSVIVRENNCDVIFHIYDIIDKTVLSTFVCLFGIVANIITLIVILRQGFSDAINVSLLGLTVSDVGALTSLLVQTMLNHPLIIKNVDLSFSPTEIGFLPSGTLRVLFSRITCYITIFILVQRCLCIALPFKIKSLLTPTRSAVAMGAIVVAAFFINIFAMTGTNIVSYGWKFSALNNKSILGVIYSDKWDMIYNIVILINGLSMVISCACITLGTIILVVQLDRKTKWRRKSTGNFPSDKLKIISRREQKLGIMVVLMSGILIVSYLPNICALLLSLFVPAVGSVNSPTNCYVFVWAVGSLFESIHAAVNIFVYYKTSSKYRETFDGLIHQCRAYRYGATN